MKFEPDKPSPFSRSVNARPDRKNGISTAWEDRQKLQKERGRHLHSKEHVLADDLSHMMQEPKRFASYLGIAKLYYESDLRALARRVLEKADLPVEARGKYFFASVKGLMKRPGITFKRKPTRKKKRNGTKATTRNDS